MPPSHEPHPQITLSSHPAAAAGSVDVRKIHAFIVRLISCTVRQMGYIEVVGSKEPHYMNPTDLGWFNSLAAGFRFLEFDTVAQGCRRFIQMKFQRKIFTRRSPPVDMIGFVGVWVRQQEFYIDM